MPETVIPTHVAISYGVHGRSKGVLPNPGNPGNPFDKPSAFAHLDGRRRWAAVWAPLPGPFDGDYRLPGIDLDTWPEEYLQAGGRRGRLCVEIRTFIDGAYRQFVVGRPPARGTSLVDGEPDEVVPFDTHSVTVFPHEVWTSARATPVFRHWFAHGELPADLTLRELDLSL